MNNMQLIINGKPKEFDEELTVQQLLAQLDLRPDRVVVELNREILDTEKHQTTQLKHNDTIELIQFVGGG